MTIGHDKRHREVGYFLVSRLHVEALERYGEHRFMRFCCGIAPFSSRFFRSSLGEQGNRIRRIGNSSAATITSCVFYRNCNRFVVAALQKNLNAL